MEFLIYVGTEHCLSIAYSKQENSLVERTYKEINRHSTSLFFDNLIMDKWRNGKSIVYRILNSTYSERTKISPADMLFGRAVDLDRGIFASFEEATLNSPVPLSKTTSDMLKLQSDFMRIHVLTAFITSCGIYQFTRVPFGPKNAPSYYQQLIAGVVLAGILYLSANFTLTIASCSEKIKKNSSQT